MNNMYLPDPPEQPSESDFERDPFENSDNTVITWGNENGQINQKIIKGPDTGVHRFYEPDQLRSGQTGYRRGDDM